MPRDANESILPRRPSDEQHDLARERLPVAQLDALRARSGPR
jgi:hypothetical protein